MRIRVENPADLPELIAVLTARVDAVVSRAAIDEIEVSLLGSRNADADVAEMEKRLEESPVKARLIRGR
jgi:hypothetical protein